MTSTSPSDRAATLAEGFAELHPCLNRPQAVTEASRCLFCFDAPCTRACPTKIDVPKFIRQILHDDPTGAAETILGANIFGGSCARACPTEVLCEGACVDKILVDSPVQIGRLQRYACDAVAEAAPAFFEPGADTGKRVAIIGAGPAGLTCAHELRKQGHAATLFEAREMAGGVNTYGIARYKYDTEFALSEVDRVLAIGGIDLRLGTPVEGKDVADLLARYDAVFVGVGLGPTAALGIDGETLSGVWEALAFIAQTRTLPLEKCRCGSRVLVIGGGNTAVDVATAAVRLGAQKVTIVYRRTPQEMPAFAYEYELAVSDGVNWEFSAAPQRFLGDAGQVTGAEFVRTRAAGTGRSAKLEHLEGSNFTLEADMIVKALGQEPLTGLLNAIAGLKLDHGRVSVDAKTGATTVPRLFAGGDCLSMGAEIVDAVEQGKIAAAGIDAMLRA